MLFTTYLERSFVIFLPTISLFHSQYLQGTLVAEDFVVGLDSIFLLTGGYSKKLA